MIERMNEIRELLRTQDNRLTCEPVFCVEQKRRDWGYESGYSDDYAWVNPECDFDIVELDTEDEDEQAAIAKFEEAEAAGEATDPWEMVHYKDRWEFVTACFTEKGAQAYIDLNGHNLGETRIYVHSGYRNQEWIDVRAALMGGALARAAKEE